MLLNLIVHREDIKIAVLKLNSAAKLFSEVLKLLHINAIRNERSFSALRRLKTYLRLRNSMSAERLNHLSILHVHKTFTDELDLNSIAAELIRLPQLEAAKQVWLH